MKKLFSLIAVILHVSGAIVAIAAPEKQAPPKPPVAPAPAAVTGGDISRVNGSITVQKGEVVRNVETVNGKIEVYGHVTGNAVAVNGNIYIRPGGRVDGDAKSVNGRIVRDKGSFLGGRSLEGNSAGFAHTRGRSANQVGNDVVVGKGQTVDEAVAVMGNLTVEGHVTGDAVAVMGNVYVRSSGKVDGDAVAVMGRVIRTGTGEVKGDVTSIGWSLPRTWLGGRWLVLDSTRGRDGWLFFVIHSVAGLVLAALLTAVVIALFPQRMTAIAEAATEKPGWSLLYGIAAALLVVPVAFLLLITCIGIPLIAVELLFVLVLAIAGIVAIELALGRRISDGIGRPVQSAVWAGVVGALVIGLVALIPFIGFPISLVLYTIGAGAALMTGFGSRPDWFASKFDRTSRQAPPMAQPPQPPAAPSGPAETQ